jgi:hypothetical protein
MNKGQGTLFKFGVKKSRIEGVCDTTKDDSFTSRLQSDIQFVQNMGKLLAMRFLPCFSTTYL